MKLNILRKYATRGGALGMASGIACSVCRFAQCDDKRADGSASSRSWPTANLGGERKVLMNNSGQIHGVQAKINYQNAQTVETSLSRNGKVGTARNKAGGDSELFGVDFVATQVTFENARLAKTAPTLEKEGFAVWEHGVEQKLGDAFDFYNNDAILERYYPSVCELVKKATGATHVYAFDHNIRCASGNKSGQYVKGGQAVQSPAHIVHTDYTITSAPKRLQDLSCPPKENDTWRKLTKNDQPLIPKAQVKQVLEDGARFAIINVWRNIKKTPVQKYPLAVCSSDTVRTDDLVVFEIHYADRIGENYFVKAPPNSVTHRWYYFPQMTRDEAMIFKQWDSDGRLKQNSDGGALICGATGVQLPPQFCVHTAFDDPSSPPEAEDRESIEVRCVALFLEPSRV